MGINLRCGGVQVASKNCGFITSNKYLEILLCLSVFFFLINVYVEFYFTEVFAILYNTELFYILVF